jgi:hypothetical protein
MPSSASSSAKSALRSAAGHRAGRHDDRACAGQGRHPVRGGRRPGHRHRGIRLASELVRGRHRDPRDPGPEVLRAWDAVGLGGPDRACWSGYAVAFCPGSGEFRQRGSRGHLRPAEPASFRDRVLGSGDHRLLPMSFVSAVETVGDVSGHHQGRRGPRGDRQGNPGRDLCRRSRHGDFGSVRRAAEHLVQPECGPDRDDRRHEPPCRDHRRDIPDPLRPRAQDRRRHFDSFRSKCWVAV